MTGFYEKISGTQGGRNKSRKGHSRGRFLDKETDKRLQSTITIR